MKLEVYLQNSITGTVYDIADICEQIQVSDDLYGEAGKLTCILQKDPNNIFQISNGSIISFIVDGKGFFFGYVFKIGTDADKNYKITAYDQLRYFKNKDVYATSNLTASQIFAKLCNDYDIKFVVKVPSKYIPEDYLHDNKTLYQIIKRGIDLSNINEGANYFIKDNFGTLTWSELSYEKTNIQIGAGSLLTDFKYEKSIDDDTYNQIKFYRENTETGKRDIWVVKDSTNINRWGLLQFLKKADDDANSSQIRQSAENYLKAKNREVETLKFEAIGIPELVSGKGIKFILDYENINKWMWIKNSVHTFDKFKHTMELEVEI